MAARALEIVCVKAFYGVQWNFQENNILYPILL